MEPRRWDLVLSCFEPVRKVTGGIGTYTRLLLELLGRHEVEGRALRVLFLTSARNTSGEGQAPLSGVEVVTVPEFAELEGMGVNNLGGPYAHFSYGVMRTLCRLQEEGHTFGLAEFPDYGNEGYYALKARAAGRLELPRVAIRLHSPDQMLIEDNDARADVNNLVLRQYQDCRYTYRAADLILYGGDAMLARVAGLMPPGLDEAVRQKAVKLPHPWPLVDHGRLPEQPDPQRPLEIGCVGRLEYRKGVDLLVQAGLRLLQRTQRPVRFHFFGKDTHTFRTTSVLAWLGQLIPPAHRDAFVFHGYVPQNVLWAEHLPKIDAFVFPSRFENYPNVLLEVLALGKPTLVSRHGCMPEIGAGFPNVAAFDPLDLDAFAGKLRAVTAGEFSGADVGELYRDRKARMDERIVSGVQALLARPVAQVTPPPLPSISFIVAHYQHSRWLPALFASLAPQLRRGDEVLVVDDCSAPEEAARAKAVTEEAGHLFLQTPQNAGPAVARNFAAAQARGELLGFVDADDEVIPDGVDALRTALAWDPGLDAAVGWMRVHGDQSHMWAASDPSPATILAENCSHVGILVRRPLFERLGGYRATMRLHFEDWELNMRLVLSGARFESFPFLAYRYRVDVRTGRNTTHAERFRQSYEAALRHALTELPPEHLVSSWPELRELLVSRLAPSPPPPPEIPLRHKVVDQLNQAVKRTPIHRVLRWAVDKAAS
jgi:glycosyltransferase involved in cell wall biosynthesis/GT2 family glycosyltransferase